MSAIIRILFLCVVMGFVPIVVTAGGSIPDYRVNGWTSPVDYQSTESCALFRQYAGHVGVDFCRNIGTEVRAIADGCVEDYMSDASYYGGTSGEGGGVILLRHTTSTGRVFYAVYGHNTPESSYLNERRCTGGNKTVKSGDIIARVHEYVGSSDHLHLGIHPDTVASEKYQSARCDKSDNCGWVDPLDFLMKNEPLDTSETLTLRCAFGYCWHPANSSDRCEDGTHHMAMTDSIVMRPVSKETACVGAWTYCRTLASGSEVSEAPVRNFWNWIAELRNNSRSDAPLWDMFEVCDSQKVLGAFTVRRRLDDSYEMVSQISHPSDLNAYPQRIELPILHANPHAYPDIRIWSVGVFDGSRELNEGKDHINPGGTYRINIYPVSEITDARNGTDDDIEHIETDTFIAYGISEEDLNWKFLCRSYTRVENLTENDPHKETCDVTIPTDMGGKRFYVKSKGDATGEVEEDDEGNNWSDEYKEWFPIRGNCNLIISWAGLDEGKTSPIKEGDKFGLKAAVQNIGSTACPGKSRISYELKLMGGAYTKVADDGVDSDQLMPGQTQWEHTMNEPFRASFISTYGLRVCADSTGANEESSESDNCYETTFDVQMSRSDLIVSDLYLRTSGGQIVRNGTSIPEDSTVHPYCVITNQGNRNTQNGIRLKYEVNSGTYRGDDGLDAGDLKVGASKTEYMSDGFRLGDTGTRSYTCCVDYQGSESELNEGNNCATIGFTVYPTAPAITITDLWVDYDGKVVREGGTGSKGKRYHPNVTFTNTGNQGMTCGAEAKYYINASTYRDRDGIDNLGINQSGHERVDNDDIKLGDKGWRSYRVTIGSNCGEFPTVERTMSFYVK